MEKICPDCGQVRMCFVGEICFCCSKANERAINEVGNWVKETGNDIKAKTGHGIAI